MHTRRIRIWNLCVRINIYAVAYVRQTFDLPVWTDVRYVCTGANHTIALWSPGMTGDAALNGRTCRIVVPDNEKQWANLAANGRFRVKLVDNLLHNCTTHSVYSSTNRYFKVPCVGCQFRYHPVAVSSSSRIRT